MVENLVEETPLYGVWEGRDLDGASIPYAHPTEPLSNTFCKRSISNFILFFFQIDTDEVAAITGCCSG